MERYTPDPIHRWSRRYGLEPGSPGVAEIQIRYERIPESAHVCRFSMRTDGEAAHYLATQIYNRAWAFGGRTVRVHAPQPLFEQVQPCFARDGAYGGLAEMMEQVYGGFELLYQPAPIESDAEPDSMRDSDRRSSRQGSHIGVDLGGSDLKVVAVADGELRFHAKQNWNPRSFVRPTEHLDFLQHWIAEARRQAGFDRIDGIGISTAGVVVGDEIPLSGLGAGLSPGDYDANFRQMARHISQHFGSVPVQVLHDGDAAALWVAVDMGITNVLGLAFGTGLGAGYVSAKGGLTGALCEIGKCIVDMSPDAPEHIYNHTRGPALHFLSQNAVFRLAPQYGIPLDHIEVRAEKLCHVQRLAGEGSRRAQEFFRYIGQWLAMAAVEFQDYYGMEHVVLFGRVASGASGEWILESAQDTMEAHFSERSLEIHLPRTPEGQDPTVIREFGQAMAASYLSSLQLSGPEVTGGLSPG